MDMLRYLYDGTFLAAALGDVHVVLLVVVTAVCIAVLSKGADWMIDGAVSLEPVLPRWVGVMFLLMLIGYMAISVRWARQRGVIAETEKTGNDSETFSLLKSWTLIVGGLTLVIAGARILIPCASEIALRLGVPQDVIAATLVAFGTSLPEVMTAVSAVRKGHPEITVGNIVGADVLNCLFVVGASLVASPLAVPRTFFMFHFPAMLLILYSFRMFIYMNRDGTFKRWQGVWLLLVYVVYVVLQYALNLGSEAGH